MSLERGCVSSLMAIQPVRMDPNVVHQLIVSLVPEHFSERERNHTNNRGIDVSGHSATFYALFPQDSSAMTESPECELSAEWPSSVTDVFWFNRTSLYYVCSKETFFESCRVGSYGETVNPYYSPAPTIAPSPTHNPAPSPPPEKPTQAPAPSPSPATQSCQTTNHGWWCAFSILIRVPYIGPSDCDATYHALEDTAGDDLTNWQCIEENGFIRLWFNAANGFVDGNQESINGALESRYPTVNRFNCDCEAPFRKW